MNKNTKIGKGVIENTAGGKENQKTINKHLQKTG